MQRDRAKLHHFRNKWNKDDEKTIPNLALTPSQMLQMAEQGIPISSNNLAHLYNEGVVNPSWEIDFDRLRGVDVNDLWKHNQDVKAKIKKAYKDATSIEKGE